METKKIINSECKYTNSFVWSIIAFENFENSTFNACVDELLETTEPIHLKFSVDVP